MSRELFTLKELETATGGRIYGRGEWESSVDGVCIDSRNCWEGCLFVPLLGEQTDGHRFIGNALDKGCRVSLVAREQWPDLKDSLSAAGDAFFVIVEDTLQALHDLARFHRNRFPDLLVFAVTGSSGKTTVKELLGAVLGQCGKTLVTEGNFNSETGLPLTVFRMEESHRYAVLEMGMNHRGEIGALASIARPDYALISNVGTAHVGLLGSRQAIAKEKKAVFSCFDGSQTAYIPADSDFFGFLAEGVAGRVVYWERSVLESWEDCGLDGIGYRLNGEVGRLALTGEYNVDNLAAVVSAALDMKIPTEKIIAGIAEVRPLFGRGEVLRGEKTVLKDCYNANPDSMAASLRFLDSLNWEGKKIAVLGDMYELGEEAQALHRRIGGLLKELSFDTVILYGSLMQEAAGVLAGTGRTNCFWTDDFSRLEELVHQKVSAGSLVLLKGSRGVALERLLPILKI